MKSSQKTRSGQFFIITAVLIAGMLFLISNTLLTASGVDYGSILRSHDVDTVENLADETDAAWWNTAFRHRKSVILEEDEGRFLQNESVRVALDAPRQHINTTCADIRVVQDGERMPWVNTTPCTIDTYTTDFTQVANDAELRYMMDEGTGQWANDSSGNANNGHLGGDASLEQTSDPNQSSGRFAGGLRFDGVDDYVAVENLVYNTAGAINEITVCGWVRTTSTSSNMGIASWDRSEYFRLGINTCGAGTGEPAWCTTDETGSTDDMVSGVTVDDGQWHHVCGVFDSDDTNDKRIFVDGELAASKDGHSTGDALGSGSTRYGFIGELSEASSFDGGTNSEFFEGVMDDVRIYHDALSADQIRGIAQNGVGLNISVTLEPESRTDALHVYYDNTFADLPPTDPAGIQHTTESTPATASIGPERGREEVLRQVDEHVERLDSELSFDLRFTLDEGCGTIAIRTPISNFATEVC